MSVSPLAGPGGPALAPDGPKRVFSGRNAWVLGADSALGRAIAVELAGRGADVWVVGADERALGEAVGEIAYQGGRGKHLVATDDTCLAALGVAGSPSLVVVATSEAPGEEWFERGLERFSPSLTKDGVFLFALTGAPPPDVGPWTRRRARAAGRSDRPFLLNVIALASRDGDVDGAARVAALVCSPAATGLSGQLVVVASA